MVYHHRQPFNFNKKKYPPTKSQKKAELGFADKTKEEMIDLYRMIYKKEDEERFGVVVFKIKTL